VVGLYLNGELVRAATTHSPEYQFENVLLTKKDNVIQIKSFNDKGSVFSNAIIVYYVASSQTAFTNSYSQPFEDNVLRGNYYRKEISLTFDGGAEANEAVMILKILEMNKIKATFFLTGEFIQKYPDIVKRLIQSNHEIGNHTFSHPHLTTYAMNHQQTTLPNVTKEFIIDELRKTDALFYKIAGRHLDPYWRAPFGETNAEIRKWASELGYMHVGWTSLNNQSMDSMDWVENASVPGYKTVEQSAAQILDFGKNAPYEANGGIILMHLGTERKEDFAEKFLPLIIDGYAKKGYGFVTISHLILHKDDIHIAEKQ
jgi:peptidoglycan/xylan/chitin deacetylase (PgdA/CDA1 family)